jgi:hypothetical protein
MGVNIGTEISSNLIEFTPAISGRVRLLDFIGFDFSKT